MGTEVKMDLSSRARYIVASTLAFSAIVIALVGIASNLPTVPVLILSFILLFLAIVSLSCRRLLKERETGLWLFLMIGLLFLGGGALGLTRSFQENWQWMDRLPLAVPPLLGVFTIWFTLKARPKPGR